MFKKKNSKKKLKRKDRFKELKKEMIPMNSAPLFIKNIYDISVIADNGLFQIDDKSFTKLYKITINDSSVKAQEVFKILRGYDCSFRVYHVHDEIYLSLLFTSENISDAWVACDNLYKDMKHQFEKLLISIDDIDANARMKVVHGQLLNNDKLPFNKTYVDNNSILDWKDAFELTDLKEEVDYFEKGNGLYKIFYVRKFSSKISGFISEISNMEEVEEIVFQFDPLSDKAAQAFFLQNYMGCENVLAEMSRKNPEVYDIYTGDNKDDSRHFTMCGMMFLLKVSNENNHVAEEKISFAANRYDVEISYFHINLKDVYKEFLPFGKWKIAETRNVVSDVAGKAFLSDCLAQEEADVAIGDYFVDADIIESSEEEKTEDLNFNIDEYDDEEE